MDPLSITASIISVLEALSVINKLAVQVRNGPRELRELSSKLAKLDEMAKILELHTRSLRLTAADTDIIQQLQQVHDELETIKEKFERVLPKKNSRFATRLRPLWQREEMKKLAEAVNTIEHRFTLAVSVWTW